MKQWIVERARIKREKGNAITNYTMSSISEKNCQKIYSTESYYATLYWNVDKYVLNFVAASLADLKTLLALIPDNTVVNILYKEKCDLDSFFLAEGLSLHATYQRTSIRYKSNPFLIPEKSKRRQILPKMYDSNFGEYPNISDAEEISGLCRKVFDPLCDDMYTIDEWKEKIRNKEILIYRENGEIIAYYLWRLEGQKLYSNQSVNLGAANTLYNMERRIFEEMWDEGIRVFYGWGDISNGKAKRHANQMSEEAIKQCADSVSKSYCNTYYKAKNME